MNVQAEKLELIEWLTKVVDEDIIRRIKAVKINSDTPIKVSVSEEEQQAISEGLEDKKAGNVREHAVVMAEIKAKYQNL